MAIPAAIAAAGAAGGGTAAAGTAAAGTAAAAGGTAAAGSAATAAGTAANAGRMANIASKAKGFAKKDVARRGVNQAYNMLANKSSRQSSDDEVEEQEETEEPEYQESDQGTKGINPVRDSEDSGEGNTTKEKKKKRKKWFQFGCCGCLGCGCLGSVIGPAIGFMLVIMIPYIVVSWFSEFFKIDIERTLVSGLTSCENCTVKELEALRQDQWNKKLEALSKKYGSKIDKPALIATLTYSDSLADVMALEYTDDKNFDANDWLGKASDGFSKVWDGITTATNGDAAQDFGSYSSVNISLLNYIAEGMSGGGTYSDEKYREWLISDGADGFPFGTLYCNAKTTFDQIKSLFSRTAENMKIAADRFWKQTLEEGKIPFAFVPKVVGGGLVSSTVGSFGFYYKDGLNHVRICEYGYIGGMIEGVNNIKDKDEKKKQKEKIADEILSLAQLYREADDAEKKKERNKKGSTCYYKVPGIEEEVSNVKVQTLRCEYGNDTGKVGDPIGEPLVDFENEYVPGVVYGEVGESSSEETQRAQAVFARSFALTRGKAMNGAYGIGLSIESGNWVLKMRNCTSDQAYCNLDQGCGTLSGGTPQGSTSGGPTLYSGGKGKGFYKGPLPADTNNLRAAVASTKGEVAINESGEVQYLNFASNEQNSWANRADSGQKYKDIIKEDTGFNVVADCRGTLGAYDLEEYYVASSAATESTNKPAVDLAGTDYQTIAGFNSHIKSNVEAAGFGTREAVVAAGVSLIGDYTMATGKRLRYDQYTSLGGRQNSDEEGIVKENFFLDCSSFAWWALYNGGFKIPTYPFTGAQKSWAQSNGYAKDPTSLEGQPGDFLVSDGHIVLILGNYDGGYYIAEFLNWGEGGRINKYGSGGFSLGGYTLIDMDGYYNASNVR